MKIHKKQVWRKNNDIQKCFLHYILDAISISYLYFKSTLSIYFVNFLGLYSVCLGVTFIGFIKLVKSITLLDNFYEDLATDDFFIDVFEPLYYLYDSILYFFIFNLYCHY